MSEIPETHMRAEIARLDQQVVAQATMILQYRAALDGSERTIAQLTAALADERAKYRRLFHAAAHPPVIPDAPDEFPARALRFSR